MGRGGLLLYLAYAAGAGSPVFFEERTGLIDADRG